MAATLKHFVVNNQEFDRYDLSSDMDERILRELYLHTFRSRCAVDGRKR